MKKWFFLPFILPTISWATPQNGLGIELGAGYNNQTIRNDTMDARYSGASLQGHFLLPIYDSGRLSIDLDISYNYTSTENNASNVNLSEWVHANSFGSGFRINYSFLFVGSDYLFTKVKHVKAGTSNQIFEYDINPVRWQAGLALPLSPVTSVIVGYSQTLNTNTTVQSTELNYNDQTYWLRLQIDFGVSFFNLFAPSESFAPTRNGFFVQ